MILCVCLNPALDITYRVKSVRAGSTHPVQIVAERAGGKGVNVASVLAQAGVPATVAGLSCGRTSERLAAELFGGGIATRFIPVHGETRRSITVVDDSDATVFNEPGPTVQAHEWDAFLAAYGALLDESDVVVLSGSLPPSVPMDAYAQLTRLAVAAGRPVLVDSKGEALRAALSAGPDVVAPNLAEAAWALGQDEATIASNEAARALRAAGAGAAVVSDGSAGFAASTPDGSWWISTPRVIVGNPTGAGDALTAAMADGIRSGLNWPQTLRRAAAWAAAAVAVGHAGEIDHALAADVLDNIEVQPYP